MLRFEVMAQPVLYPTLDKQPLKACPHSN